MKYLIVILPLLLILTSCFKDDPTSEFSKVAGSWEMNKISIQYYDSIGTPTTSVTSTDVGYLMLNYNDGASAENSFAYSINNSTDPVFFQYGSIFEVFSVCDRWDVSVNAEHINFGYYDPVSLGTYQVSAFTITKLKSKKMNLMHITRHTTGALKSMEVLEMQRGN